MQTLEFDAVNDLVFFKDKLKCYDGEDIELRFFTVYENNTFKSLIVTPIQGITVFTIILELVLNPILEDLLLEKIYLKNGEDYTMQMYVNNELLHTELIKVR